MLEGLDNIDWSKLSHAHGAAANVPELIRALVTPDAQEREAATRMLLEYIWHQGTMYSSTAHTIRFFNEMIATEDSPCKFHALIVLTTLAGSTLIHGDWRDRRTTPTWFEYQRQVFDELRKHRAFYAGLLHHAEPGIRTVAADVLGYLLDDRLEVSQYYEQAIVAETDERVKAELIRQIGELLSDEWRVAERAAEIARMLENLVLHDASRLVRVAAAITIGYLYDFQRRSKIDVSPAALNVLIEGYIDPLPADDDDEFWYYHTSMFAYDKQSILRVLAWLTTKHHHDGILRLFQHPALSMDDTYIVGREVIDVGFHRYMDLGRLYPEYWGRFETSRNDPTPKYHYRIQRVGGVTGKAREYYVPGVPLNERQRLMLRPVVDSDKFWQTPTNLFSFFYGLPDSRDELRKLLEA